MPFSKEDLTVDERIVRKNGGMISYYINCNKNYVMKEYFLPIAIATILLIFSACNNTGNTTANAGDTLSTDSSNVPGIDHTAVPKDSGTMASAMPVDTADKAFLIKAASGGMLEVYLGSLAEDSAKSARVKQFGGMMVKDHTDANSNLKSIIKQLQVSIPDSMMAEHTQHKMGLEKIKAVAFDKAYMKMMIEDHKEDIADFKKAAKSNNTLIKNFATQTLPVLNKHLDSANVIARGIK